MNDCLGEERVTVQQKMASDSGFIGVSLLNRLNVLHGFNILKGMVFDTMHTLILRVALRHNITMNAVEKRLEKMPWTAG